MVKLSQTDRAREQRACRRLAHAGFILEKTPPRHWTRYYGAGYQIVRGFRCNGRVSGIVVAGCSNREYEMKLEQLEELLDDLCKQEAVQS